MYLNMKQYFEIEHARIKPMKAEDLKRAICYYSVAYLPLIKIREIKSSSHSIENHRKAIKK